MSALLGAAKDKRIQYEAILASGTTGRVGAAAIPFLVQAWTAPATMAELPPLIPRHVLFGTPESSQNSSGGRKLPRLATGETQVLQAWMRTIGQRNETPVKDDRTNHRAA